MNTKLFAWLVTGTGTLVLVTTIRLEEAPSLGIFVYWVALTASAELLTIALSARVMVTMSFPIHLALVIVFREQIWVAMLVAALSTVDIYEIKRQMPLHKALFNKALALLSVGAASLPFVLQAGTPAISPPSVAAAALLHLAVNLGLMTIALHLERGIPIRQVARVLVPSPIAGFALSYGLLTGLGAATAIAYERVGEWVVAAIVIPLLFARLSIVGAKTQQELSEKVQEQQKALLEASERVFREREEERKRIAADIHDSSLQLITAASFGAGNALDFLRVGKEEQAQEAIDASRRALDEAVKMLRGSLADLRRSSVEAGGLKDTINTFAEQAATLWGSQVKVQGQVRHEPPAPVALAAFQILQEGLVNALKHSRSDEITVTITDDDGWIHIIVEDDGAGFNPEAEVSEDHVGMRLMKERAESLGGRIDLVSAPGSGTRLEAILPGGVAT